MRLCKHKQFADYWSCCRYAFVLAVIFFDRAKIDDPVGALSVHLVNGVFGTIAVRLFAQNKLTGTETGNGLFYGGGM